MSQEEGKDVVWGSRPRFWPLVSSWPERIHAPLDFGNNYRAAIGTSAEMPVIALREKQNRFNRFLIRSTVVNSSAESPLGTHIFTASVFSLAVYRVDAGVGTVLYWILNFVNSSKRSNLHIDSCGGVNHWNCVGGAFSLMYAFITTAVCSLLWSSCVWFRSELRVRLAHSPGPVPLPARRTTKLGLHGRNPKCHPTCTAFRKKIDGRSKGVSCTQLIPSIILLRGCYVLRFPLLWFVVPLKGERGWCWWAIWLNFLKLNLASLATYGAPLNKIHYFSSLKWKVGFFISPTFLVRYFTPVMLLFTGLGKLMGIGIQIQWDKEPLQPFWGRGKKAHKSCPAANFYETLSLSRFLYQGIFNEGTFFSLSKTSQNCLHARCNCGPGNCGCSAALEPPSLKL